MFENLHFGRIARKILNLVKIFLKSRFLPKFSKIATMVYFFRKLPIGVEIAENFLKNLDFGRNFRKISILLEFIEKSW